LLEYLVFYLSSPQIINYINRLTTGSTKESRGRFKENQLLSMKIPMPKKKEVFNEIVKSIKLIKDFQKQIKDLSEKVKELPKSFQISLPNISE
jgi:restriction endonuclease S subunit